MEHFAQHRPRKRRHHYIDEQFKRSWLFNWPDYVLQREQQRPPRCLVLRRQHSLAPQPLALCHWLRRVWAASLAPESKGCCLGVVSARRAGVSLREVLLCPLKLNFSLPFGLHIKCRDSSSVGVSDCRTARSDGRCRLLPLGANLT